MSIIRRRHNGSFTQIGNDVLDDERLSFEAVGMLAYLLSKPDDWQVRLPQLRKRAKIGRDKLRRILSELVQLGYVLRKKIRDATGAFIGDEFEVYDRPQIVDHPDIDREGIAIMATASDDDEPGPENPSLGQPAPGYPAPEKASLAIYKDSTNTEDSPKPDSHQVEREARAGARAEKTEDPRPWERDPAFMAAMKAWWTVDGIANAWREWAKMEPDARAEAARKIPVYLAMHQTRSERCAFSTYLGQRPFALLPEPQADGQAPSLRAEIVPKSRAWCTVFFDLAVDGSPSAIRRAREIMTDAEFSRKSTVPLSDMPDDAALAPLVKIERGGAAFTAWRRWLSDRRGREVWLKPEVFGEWLWVPSEFPPGVQAESEVSGEAQSAETDDEFLKTERAV